MELRIWGDEGPQTDDTGSTGEISISSSVSCFRHCWLALGLAKHPWLLQGHLTGIECWLCCFPLKTKARCQSGFFTRDKGDKVSHLKHVSSFRIKSRQPDILLAKNDQQVFYLFWQADASNVSNAFNMSHKTCILFVLSLMSGGRKPLVFKMTKAAPFVWALPLYWCQFLSHIALYQIDDGTRPVGIRYWMHFTSLKPSSLSHSCFWILVVLATFGSAWKLRWPVHIFVRSWLFLLWLLLARDT